MLSGYELKPSVFAMALGAGASISRAGLVFACSVPWICSVYLGGNNPAYPGIKSIN